MVSQKKINQVDNIIKLLEENQNFALINFEKTRHQNFEKLRKNLKKTNSKIKIIKNTLLEKAVQNLSSNNKLMSEFGKTAFPSQGNTALLTFDKVWDKGLGDFYKFINEEKTLNFKVGILDNNIYNAGNLKKIAQLPPKEQLVAKLIGSIKAPLNNLVYNMKFNMNKFVYILGEKAKKE